MKYLAVIALFALASSGASAGGHSKVNQASATTQNVSASSSSVRARLSQRSASSASTGNSSASVTSPDRMTYDGGYTVRNTPDISLGAAVSTAPCRVAVGGALSLAGTGGAITGSTLDEGCDFWRRDHNLRAIGRGRAADKLLCSDDKIAQALGSECGSEAQQQPATKPAGHNTFGGIGG